MISCIGVGPGHLDWLTRRGAALITAADVVAGFASVVEVVRPLLRPEQRVITMGYRDQVDRLAEVAALHHAGQRCAVVFMGDVHFSGFQYLERVERACGHPVETVPGISSAQLLASRGRVCFDETTFVTFHRRGDLTPFKTHLRDVLRAGRHAIVIPRPWDLMPGDIAAYLLGSGLSAAHRVEVWENLSREEAAWRGTLGELEGRAFSDLSILLIRALKPLPTGLEGEA
ncbi:cobalt-precorrin-7 (C(5))-methyltransferase [Deinococcus sp. YIM 77859]|uniref:cobalt-precorrin-7 (C(5))-methyltransferase n=1 Tax=Deinococcus sp. YIM 77859 TaxID=1540221 RepID=UPI00054FAB7F|nr:cobalt-precorrin-7 (C(5))-methyltransferase [Deinococcus sp. YIM 77859]